jgi:hypothetical protein
MKQTKPKTNVQLVRHIMEYSQVGALKQAFVIEALHYYSHEILNDTTLWPQNSVVSQEAWQTCAEETLASITGRNV